MNNNRNNNRRRGGGRNNNRNQGGNPNAQNRIDNRARGNAPQLLDKYKKLAQDAYHNGDRVQQEYYLQFADHYHRVIADNKARQDEARAKRNEERGDSGDDSDGNDDEANNPGGRQNNRRPRGRRDEQNDDRGEDRGRSNGRGRGRNSRSRDENGSEDSAENGNRDEGRQQSEGEEGENPFTRDPKRPRKARAKPAPSSDDGAFDVSALPPAIGADDAAEEKPKPKRAPRRKKVANDSDAEAAS